MDTQLSMGFEGAPDIELPYDEQPFGLPPVPRPQHTWVLLANRRGTIGFHHLLYVAPYGLHVALCGAKGRKVTEDSPQVVLCPLCAAQRLSGGK